jgi:hypothetical protein
VTQKFNQMIIFIKKIKSKEGINALNIEKIKKEIPEGYAAIGNDPAVSFTANHVVVAFNCVSQPKPAVVKKKSAVKTKNTDKPKSADKNKVPSAGNKKAAAAKV